MKRIFCLIIIFSLFLVSCKKATSITPVVTDISFTLEVSSNDEKLEYDAVIKNQDDNIFVEITDPSSGIIFNFSNGKLTEKLHNLESTSDISSIATLSSPEMIYAVINDISKNNIKVEYKEDTYYIESKTDKYDYKIYFAESGIPLKINEKNTSVEIIIKNAKLL